MAGKKVFNYLKKNILIQIYIIIILIFSFFCRTYREIFYIRKLNLKSEIILTIKGKGKQQILSNKYQDILPSEIYIDGIFHTSYSKEVNIQKKGEHNITLKWNSIITNCMAMFSDLSNIIKIDFSKFDTSYATTMFLMFGNCISLISLDLSRFNTSLVKDMCSMFYECISLTSINLANFDTSLVTNMYTMFYDCYSLTSLEVNHFNTSLVNNMNNMFSECHSIISLDLSNFNTSSVENMDAMFYSCYSLISLDLKNFNTEKVLAISDIFHGCRSLIFLNLASFVLMNRNTTANEMFTEINRKVILCIDISKNPIVNFGNLLSNIDCNNTCFKDSKKINVHDQKCVFDCNSNSENQYEYNNKCYPECPENTHSSSENEFLCEDNIKVNCKELGKYYNYNQTLCIDEIPEGYFLNDTIYNTIDKCHQDCKTCDKKYNDTNSNCNSCLNDKYFYWGNCLSNCTNGYFIDSSGKKICKCISNKKCKECLNDNLEPDMCISCNAGYFQKIDEIHSDNSLIKCYKDPEGYYLDNDIYKPCYPSCKKCSELGDKNDHKCIECLSDYGIKENNNCYKNCSFYYYYTSKMYLCTYENKCPEEQNKLILDKKKCIDECINDDTYQFEFNNTCYKSCPEGTKISKNNNHLCSVECPENKPYENQNSKCTQECNAIDFFNGICKINNNNPKTIDDMAKTIKEQLNQTLDEFMMNITNNEQKDLLIKAKDTTYQITTTDNQKNNKYEDVSVINLGECENILKTKNHIDPSKSLIIFKIDYYVPGISIPVIGYEVYHPDTKVKLELDDCKNALIDLDIPVSINENELFKNDPNNEYYTNECFPYTSENGTDIILNDRKEEFIDNNLSLCENKCSYNGYNENTKKVSCECEAKSKEFVISELISDKNLLSNNFVIDNSTNTNLITMKCIYTLFTKEGMIDNIASYILASILLLFIILAILFYKIGFYFLENDIQEIISLKQKNGINNGLQHNKKLIKIKKKKKKEKKEKDLANPKKRKKIGVAIKQANIQKENNNIYKSSSKINLKNTVVLMNSEKEQSNNHINIYNNKIKRNDKMNFYDFELNSFDFKESLKYDKRTYIKYYFSLIKRKHPIIFAFIPVKDYNTMIIKYSLFLVSFVIYFSINTLLFTDKTVHKIYEDQGVYNVGYHIPKIILSFIISHIIFSIIKYFSLSERDILKIKYELSTEKAMNKADKIKRCLIMKYICFYLIGVVFLIFFWYYLSSFCSVYKNSQIHLIINTIISFSLSILYPFVINLIPGSLRIISLKNRIKYLFYVSKVLQLL